MLCGACLCINTAECLVEDWDIATKCLCLKSCRNITPAVTVQRGLSGGVDVGCWAGFEIENADKQLPASLCRWMYEGDREKLIDGGSVLQQSGPSDVLFLYFHPDKNMNSYPSWSIYPQTCTPTHLLTRLCVFVCKHSRHAGVLHVLFTPVILLHTAMETEFGIQISLLSGGMSVSDLELFRGASFSSSIASKKL